MGDGVFTSKATQLERHLANNPLDKAIALQFQFNKLLTRNMRKLKIGNTIKTAWSIYRDRFKEYYYLAFTNSFWIFVPVYGWAKYATMMGLLARLAYGDIIGNSETIVEAKRYIKPKTWLFFDASFTSSKFFYREIFAIRIIIEVFAIILIENNTYLAINIPFLVAINSLILYEFSWLKSHFLLYELPLAIGKASNSYSSRKIASKLAGTSLFDLQIVILFFSFNFVLPYFIMQNYILNISTNRTANQITLHSTKSILNMLIHLLDFSNASLSYLTLSDLTLSNSGLFYLTLFKEAWFFLGIMFVPILPSVFVLLCIVGSSIFGWFSHIIIVAPSILIFTIVNLAIGALLIPFWQSLKAVLYYRLNLSLKNKYIISG